ncbi:sine oculis-binding protein homolog [Carassius auratus]|uniref:Sine oculis-binding protein homolog n=1 Tax=Carassius auratus TaxID=7957 RepID=A0A6P6PM73_CARAU|nr:sine oculis-binding protein homolog [Carassius auratus]
MEAERPAENKRSRKPAHPVKRAAREEMKSFAESTMNEMLGWYGYDSVDAADGPNRVKHHHISPENSKPQERKLPSSSSSSETVRISEKEPASPSSSSYSSSLRSRNVIVPLIKPSSAEDEQSEPIVCVWCQKEGMKRYSLLMGSELKSFCSEKCFAACRRAFFKHNKARDEDRHGNQSPPPGQTQDTPSRLLLKMNNNTRVCDWCKRTRHTEEYLDFGSGEKRLRFCSRKCLNQYKMDVFYQEARTALADSGSAHKDEQPRPQTAVTETHKLLTPEAWDRPVKTLSPQTPISVRIQSSATPSSPEKPPPQQMPLPFVLKSPAPNPLRPLSPIQRATFAPPPLRQHYHAPYMPLPPVYTPHLAPPWPQPMILLPYPVFVPIPVPIPIPIPIPPQMGHRGVIRSLQEQEEEGTADPGHTEETTKRVKSERCTSPLSPERQVIQCLRKHKEEAPTHRPLLYTSVAPRIASPASLYSLARTTAVQATSFSLDSAGSALIPSPLSDCEDVKENSYLSGRGDGSTNRWPAEQTECRSDQSKESRGEEEVPQDVEHTYTWSVPPKLREKNTLMATQTHLHTQTHSWEKNTELRSEPSGRNDPEPPFKRRCLRTRDQNK